MNGARQGTAEETVHNRHQLPNSLRRLGKSCIFLFAITLLSSLPSQAQTLGEALDTTNLVWTTGGDAGWFTQITNTHDGVDAVRSGGVSSNQTSWIETTVVGPATVSYWRSGAAYAYLFNQLRLTVNGMPSTPAVEPGNDDWDKEVCDLGEGTNVLRWSVSDFYGWLDYAASSFDAFSIGPPRPLAITANPVSATVFSGMTVSRSVSAVGTPPLQYQWQRDGTNIVESTNSRIYFEHATTNDTGVYSVVVSNSQGYVISSNALLTVLPPTAPFFTQEPASVTVYSGGSAYFWSGVDGSPPFTYQWRNNGTNLPGATTDRFYLESATTNDTGVYTIVVSNAQGFVISGNALVTVLPPTAPFLWSEPGSVTVFSGEYVYLRAVANGSPPFAYQWRKEGAAIVGATSDALYIQQATTNDTGSYSIVVSNSSGFVISSNAVATVLPPTAPFFTYEPVNITAYSGKPVSLGSNVRGSPPFSYQWHKDGTNLPGATTSWLQLPATTTNDIGAYSVVISNSQGQVTSSNALVTILPPTAPFFTYEPVSVTAYSGGGVYLWAGVDGSPPFVYQWRKDGADLPGATASASLTLNNVSSGDAGSYTLLVTNGLGRIESSNVILTVVQATAPIITRHPRSLEVAAGVSTWFSVEVAGGPEPTCTWSETGTNTVVPPPQPPGPFPPKPPDPLPQIGSKRRQFSDVTTNDAGVYVAAATNSVGGVVSRDALLTVLPPLSTEGSWWQGAEDVFVTNGFAVLAQGLYGMAVLSVSNPASPVVLGGYNTSGFAASVQVADGLAYVADGASGLQILAVAEPQYPARVGGYNTSGYAYDVVVRGSLAFVADGAAGLLILDVSNPAQPLPVGSYTTNLNAKSVCLRSNVLHIGSQSGSVVLLDVTNPAQPVELGRVPSGGPVVDVRDHFVFVAGNSGVRVSDISDPHQPVLVGSFNYYPPSSSVSVSDLRVVGDFAYVVGRSDGKSGLYVLNVRDPHDPAPVGYFELPGAASRLFVDGHLVYVVGADMPLQIIETPFDLRPVGAPSLALAEQAGLKLHLQGRRGLHYSVEHADGLTGFPWLPLQTLLLTNDNAVIELPSPSGTRFFRLRQLD